MKIRLPRAHAHRNTSAASSYYDYSSYKIETGDIDDYRICQRMGKGKYSEVFEGRALGVADGALNKTAHAHTRVVIKVLKPVKPTKIAREILILRNLSHPNIIPLREVVHDSASDTFSLVFDYIRHKDTADLFQNMGISAIKIYMKQVLEALAYAHSMGIMHRDIKPQNLIINTTSRQLRIIDWGLAEFYHPSQEYSVRVASRYYKSPELLVDYPYYDYSLDIWSFGCVLAELVYRKAPFFHGSKNSDQLAEIMKVLGKRRFEAYLKEFDIPYGGKRAGEEEGVPLAGLLPESQREVFGDAVDLLEKILVYDHSARPTAEECLKHAFFGAPPAD